MAISIISLKDHNLFMVSSTLQPSTNGKARKNNLKKKTEKFQIEQYKVKKQNPLKLYVLKYSVLSFKSEILVSPQNYKVYHFIVSSLL